jgi:hypothetical protein
MSLRPEVLARGVLEKGEREREREKSAEEGLL